MGVSEPVGEQQKQQTYHSPLVRHEITQPLTTAAAHTIIYPIPTTTGYVFRCGNDATDTQ